MKTNPSARRGLAAVLAVAAGAGVSTIRAEEDPAALRERIAALEKRLADLESKEDNAKKIERLREDNKTNARKRAAEDRRHYKPEELAEIESLYQVANKNWRTDEARESLKKLLDTYDRANRTGCATLYMGQMSDGQGAGSSTSRARSRSSATVITSMAARSAAMAGMCSRSRCGKAATRTRPARCSAS